MKYFSPFWSICWSRVIFFLILICDCWSSLTPAGRKPGGEDYKSRASVFPASTGSPETIPDSPTPHSSPTPGLCPAQALPSLHVSLSAIQVSAEVCPAYISKGSPPTSIMLQCWSVIYLFNVATGAHCRCPQHSASILAPLQRHIGSSLKPMLISGRLQMLGPCPLCHQSPANSRCMALLITGASFILSN